MAFDYRFRSFLEVAVANRDARKVRADRFRKERGDDGGNEVAIARHEGAAEAFGWIADELQRLESELPTAVGALPPKTDAQPTSDRVRLNVGYALDYADAAMSNGRNYGWNDARYPLQDCIRHLQQAKAAMSDGG